MYIQVTAMLPLVCTLLLAPAVIASDTSVRSTLFFEDDLASSSASSPWSLPGRAASLVFSSATGASVTCPANGAPLAERRWFTYRSSGGGGGGGGGGDEDGDDGDDDGDGDGEDVDGDKDTGGAGGGGGGGVGAGGGGDGTMGVSSVDRKAVALDDVPGLRRVHPNGTLMMSSFAAAAYTARAHRSTCYCTAQNPAGRVRSRDLAITAVLREPYTVRLEDQKAMRGSTAVFRCVVPSYMTSYVTVTAWERDTVPIAPDGRFLITRAGVLHISDVQKEDEAHTYRCATRHRYTGESHTSNSARLAVMEPARASPVILDSMPGHTQVWAGQSVELACRAVAHPPPTHRWVRDGKAVMQTQGRYRMDQAALRIDNAHPGDSGTYACEVWNELGAAHTSGRLTVTEPLRVSLSPRNVRTSAGSSVVLTCTVSGGGVRFAPDPALGMGSYRVRPGGARAGDIYAASDSSSPRYPGWEPEFRITWYHNGERLREGGGARVQGSHNQTLVLTSVTRAHAGAYQCFAVTPHDSQQDYALLALEDGTPKIVASFRERVVSPGEAFSLVCTARGNPAPTLSWQLDGEPLPSDAPRLTLATSPAVGVVGDVADVALVMSHVNVSMARVTDSGTYRCVARNAHGEASYQATVNVRGPPSIRPMRNVTALAGHDVFMHCRVVGYPYYSIRWLRDGLPLPVNHRQSVYANGTLRLSEAQKGQDEGEYVCSVLVQPQHSIHASTHLGLRVPPIIQPFEFPSVSVGQRVFVSCVVVSGELPILISWRCDGRPIREHGAPGVVSGSATGVRVETLEYTSSLRVASASPVHDGNYTCVASNAAATATHSSRLTVRVPPRFVVPPGDQDGIFGRPAVLNCSAEGYPAPSITWKYSAGGGIPSFQPLALGGGGRLQLLANGSLLLTRTLETDAGHYLCQVSNGVGTDISKAMLLSVRLPAMITRHPNASLAVLGRREELQCSARGDRPLLVRWEKDDSVIQPERSYRYAIDTQGSAGEMTSTLQILPAMRGDSGFYSCHAVNSYGEDRAIIQLTVQEPPDPPEVNVREVTSRSITLRWSAGFNGNSPITGFDIQYKNASEPWERSQQTSGISPEISLATVIDLHPATSYRLRVAARNHIGRGDASSEILATTQEAAPDGAPLEVVLEPVSSQSIRVSWMAPLRELRNGLIRGYQVGFRELALGTHFIVVDALTASGAAAAPSDTASLDGTTTEGGGGVGAVGAVGGAVVGGRVTLDPETGGSVLLRGLRKYAGYAVVVQAYNRAGTGPTSPEATTTTLEDVPSRPPGTVSVVAMSSEAVEVTWEPPPRDAFNGVLTGYRVTYWPLSTDGDPGEVSNVSTTETRAQLRGLLKYTEYSVQVAACTRAGEGARSPATQARTAEDVPGSPAGIKAAAASANAAMVSWLPPLTPNGLIRKYTIYLNYQGQPHTVVSEFESAPDTLLYRVGNLRTGTRYVVSVSASTAAGRGNATHSVPVEAMHKAPARVLSFGGRVSSPWMRDVQLPCRSVGEPGPSVRWTKDSDGVPVALWSDARRLIHTNGSLVIRAVKADDSGFYSCEASNSWGSDRITLQLTVQVPPDQPRLSVSKTTANSITLTWVTGDDGGSNIRGYVLQLSSERGERWDEVRVGPGERSLRVQQLRCGTWYKFTLAARNAVGTGRISEILEAKTQGKAPWFSRAEPDSHTLSFVNSTHAALLLLGLSDGGCPLTSFSIEFRPIGTPGTPASSSSSSSSSIPKLPGLTKDSDLPGSALSLGGGGSGGGGTRVAPWSHLPPGGAGGGGGGGGGGDGGVAGAPEGWGAATAGQPGWSRPPGPPAGGPSSAVAAPDSWTRLAPATASGTGGIGGGGGGGSAGGGVGEGWWRADGWSRVHAVLASLREGTWYEVRARACNAAGCSERLHSFATLDANGGTVPPLTRLDADSPRVPDGDGVALTASLCCGLLLLSAILALACAVRKHRRQRRLKRLRDAKSLAEMLMSTPSKSSRAGDPPKWQPQTPRVHVDVPRAQLLIDDKGSTERLGTRRNTTTRNIAAHGVWGPSRCWARP
ncbi:cell adhesion molecule DSCAM-like isoform X2 [Petromyzon marinus]|uniref:cell adhesion molecule DSCAM-like isoform X2 n=1 Tax=Petromyzon marinus TaxID=7757 RepID=UPI003F72119A